MRGGAVRVAVGLCRIVLGAILLVAAATKLSDMANFAEEVANYRLLPAAAVPLAATGVVGIELVAGAALLLGVASRAAALVTGGLLVVFIAALSQALLRGIDLACGCFGGKEPATWGTVWRDVLMLAAVAAVLWIGPGAFALRERKQG